MTLSRTTMYYVFSWMYESFSYIEFRDRHFSFAAVWLAVCAVCGHAYKKETIVYYRS